MVRGVDGDLYIVADGGGAFATSSHRTGVGIGQRDLLVGCILNRLLHYLQGAHLPAQAGNLLLQPDRLGLGDIALFAVGSVQRSQVTRGTTPQTGNTPPGSPRRCPCENRRSS